MSDRRKAQEQKSIWDRLGEVLRSDISLVQKSTIAPSYREAESEKNRKETTSGAKDRADLISFSRRSNTATPRPSEADKWLETARNYLSKLVRYKSVPLIDAKVEFRGVYAGNAVYAVCEHQHLEYHTMIRFIYGPHAEISCSCTTRERPSISGCVHSIALVRGLIDILQNPDSPLTVRINQGKLDKKLPRRDVFRPSPASLALACVADLAEQAENEVDEQAAEILDDEVSSVKSRLQWKLSSMGCNGLELWQQPMNKKGTGWLKGEELDLVDFDLIPESSMGVGERRIKSYFSRFEDYGDIEIAVVEILRRLSDASNVEINGKPARIGYCDAVFKLTSWNGKIRFIDNSSTLGPGDWTIGFHSDGITIDELNTGRILVCPLSDFQSEALRNLVRLEPVPIEMAQALIEKTIQTQASLPVAIDESLGASLTPVTVKPVCLLRSNRDGRLNYGIRMRTSRGALVRPGKGRIVETEIIDGKICQYHRSQAEEYTLAQQTLLDLGFDSFAYEGSLGNLDQALELIQKLQDLDGQVEVLWEKSSTEPIRYLGAVTAKNVSVGITRKRDWFNINGTCKFDNQTIELSDLLNLATGEENGDYVKLEGVGWAKMSADLRKQLGRLRDAVSVERKAIKFDLSAAHTVRDLHQYVQFDTTKDWDKCLQRLERAEKLEPQVPKNLKANLREYQVEGYRWMRRLAEWGVSGVLADDMGLGKTVQTLAVLLDRKAEGPALVIAPTSVGFNWRREAEKFAPELRVHLYRDTDRQEFLGQLGPGDLVICSYGLALRDIDKLNQVEWGTMVLDEAQVVKNSRAKTSQAIATIPATWRLALTGTPVENHLGELWSLFHVISPGVFGQWEQFRKRFAAPIEKDQDPERMEALRHRLQPFVLRRTKKEVLQDLPARTESNIHVEMSTQEQAIYERVRREAIGEIDSITKLTDVKDQRFRILALLTRLRQLACHPRLVLSSWEGRSSKLTQLLETVTELRAEGHRVLIFSQFVQHLQLIREMFDEEKITYQYLDGSTSPTARQEQVDQFQNGRATAFLISLKAGGTGLNLTAADYVIHMDPWWNPAVEDQATDRAHRIGQVKPVMVYRMISENTIEEEILKLHESKRDLIAGVLEGAHAAAKLSTADLIELIRKD